MHISDTDFIFKVKEKRKNRRRMSILLVTANVL